MKKTVYLLSVSLMVFMNFCNENQNSSLKKEIPKPPVVFIGIDGSGSYDFFDKGKAQVKRLIGFTPPGTHVFIRLITSDSYLDNNFIVTKQVPMDLSNTEENPFDPREKLKKRIYQEKIKKIKNELLTRVLETQYPRSPFTDIYGFILYVQDKVVESKSNGNEIYMIILSDLENNVDKYRNWLEKNSFTGAKVYLCVYQQTTPANRCKWMEIFKELGAAPVKIYGVDQEIPDIFKQNELYLAEYRDK